MNTIKKAPNENKEGVTAKAVKQCKGNEFGDLLNSFHSELLPALYTGWVSSDECAAMAPHLRAAMFGQYTALQNLLIGLEKESSTASAALREKLKSLR
jgi:hypothetical protein